MSRADCLAELREAARKKDIAAFSSLAGKCGRDAVMVAVELKCAECARAAAPLASKKDLDDALIAAALAGAVDVAEVLLDTGADPNARGADGRTPLFIAVMFNYLGLAELLLKRGANVNAKDGAGMTPLHAAFLDECCAECVELLLKHRANPNAKDNQKLTPLDYAARGGCAREFELLLRHGARPTERTLKKALQRGDRYEERRAIVAELLETVSGRRVNCSKCGFFAEAVRRGDVEIVRALLERIKPHIYACLISESGSAEVFRMLVERGYGRLCFANVANTDVLREAVKIFGPDYVDEHG
ncbi:MAG: ankyrin repeat domain-containing protein, partial [Thermoproteus sp.]